MTHHDKMTKMPKRARKLAPARMNDQVIMICEVETGTLIRRMADAHKVSVAEIMRMAWNIATPGMTELYPVPPARAERASGRKITATQNPVTTDE